jgi:hypothetical protein
MAKKSDEPEYHEIQPGEELRSEHDLYRLKLIPYSTGYLYVFQIDSRGRVQWFFPKNAWPESSQGVNPVAAHEPLLIPRDQAGAAREYHLDDHTGFEHLYAVFAASPWPGLEAALASASSASGSDSAPSGVLRSPIAALELGQSRGAKGMSKRTDTAEGPVMVETLMPAAEKHLIPSLQNLSETGPFLLVERWFTHVP